MTTQPVEANVVLTADNTAYDQAMMQSAGSTMDLGKSIDSLAGKINNLSKSAGRKMLAITAADVALITGATTAWASYEKQVSRLNAQSAILAKSTGQQTRLMKDYEGAVKGLRTEFGTTTTEAAQLVEVLSKVTNVRQSRGLTDLSKVFMDMSKATGESSVALGSSVTNLQKIMGDPITEKTSKKYADMFTYLSAQTQITATGLADFTAQIAPMAEQMGMNEKQVAGFATAFTRAGQEGFAAGNVFNKITGDITNAIQSGSAEMTHYANLIGVTSEQFKGMDAGEQVLRVMEELQRMGPRASVELARLGLEGPKSMRAITAVSQEPGGVREALRLAEEGAASGASTRGAESAMEGLADEFEKLKESMLQTAEAMATIIGPVVEAFVGGLTKVQNIVRDVAEGPMGKFVQVIMGLLAPGAAAVGFLALFAGALLKVAAAFTLFRSSGAYGFREGLQGKPGMVRQPDGTYVARGPEGTMLGDRGAEIARGPSTWFTRGMYNTGQVLGTGAGSGIGALKEAWMSGREKMQPGYERPTGSRGPLSYLAGGIGHGIDWMFTPQLDQMRYQDVTDRKASRMFGEKGPITKFREWAASAAEPRVATVDEMVAKHPKVYEANVEAARAKLLADQYQGVGDTGVADAFKKQANAAQDAADRTVEATRTKVQADVDAADATRKSTAEVKKSTVGFNALAKGMYGGAKGVGGAMVGGALVGGEALMRSGMGMPIAGAIGMGVMGATGVESQTAMMTAMGATMGPWGAGAGLVAGVALDTAAANDKVSDSIKAVQDQATEASKSGTGLNALHEGMTKAREDLMDLEKSYSTRSSEFWWDIGTAGGAVKNDIEAIFGMSDIEELEADANAAENLATNTETVIRDLASIAGVSIGGSDANQRKELEEFYATTGASMISESGIDLEQLVEAKTPGMFGRVSQGLGITPTYEEDLETVKKPPLTKAMERELLASGGIVGQLLVKSPAAQEAVQMQGNVEAVYEATEQIWNTALEKGKTFQEIMASAEQSQQIVGDEQDRYYELAMQLSSRAQQTLAIQAPQIGRAAAFEQQLDIGKGLMEIDTEGMTAEQLGQLEQQKAVTAGAVGDQITFMRQALEMTRQYNVGRERAEDDYALQRQYQEEDYQTQRARAEENFHRMRSRQVADYHRSVRRAWYDFHLSRQRQEEEYNHSLAVQAKQQAMGIFDIYDRVQTERISSAEWLLVNAQDQLDRMQEQSKNLGRVREMGLSANAIQQLKLTDPANAQQLASLVSDLTPKMIAQFNKVAGTQRIKAARELFQDPSSLEFSEMARSYKRGRRIAQEDMEMSMDRSHQDFKRGLSQQRTDFNIAMDQQAEDYDKMMGRQEKSYNLTMKRQAEDFANYGREMLYSVEKVFTLAGRRLTGAMGKQADDIILSIENLKKETTPEAIALMTDLANIFGFEYEIPKGVKLHTSGERRTGVGGASSGGGRDTSGGVTRADGGTVPGWSPGRDTQVVHVSGGEAIMRPEWARAVGEKNIDAMNHKAKHGGFAEGGVVDPDGRTSLDGEPVTRITKAQLLLAEKLAHANLSVMQGSFQPYTSYSGSSHMGPGVVDTSPGTFEWQKWLRRVGFAAWARNIPGAAYAGSGAHIHSVSRIDPGARGHAQLSSWSRGEDGLGGQDYGPNPAVMPNLMEALSQFGNLQLAAGAGSGGAVGGALGGMTKKQIMDRVLRRYYPKAEDAAWEMDGAQPLKQGDISTVLNRFARKKIDVLLERYGAPGGGGGGMGAVPNAPGNVTGNQALVKRAMIDAGFGGQWGALYQLVMNESGFNNTAQNPSSTAYGMFQFLDGTWAGTGIAKTSDAWKQAVAGMRYIKNRYGDPNGAMRFWNANHWYQDGSVFTSPANIGVGENGPEAVIPLNARGADYMADVMGSVMGGRNVQASGRGLTVYNTRVDRSTNFTGAITVQANNPHELINKLQQRQRVMALSRPSLTGSAA